MNAIGRYLEAAQRVLNTVARTQADAMERAARKMAECLARGGLIYAFGTGHAHMIAEELFYRAGGLVAVYPILDEKLMLHVNASGSTRAERKPGYAAELLSRYPIKAGDVLVVASNSGRNAVPVEMASIARKLGACVIVLTNIEHTKAVTPNYPLGKKLMDEADIVIDNCGCFGDAAIDVNGHKMGATSTVACAAIVQALSCRAAEVAAEMEKPAEVYASSNVPGGDEINEAAISKYKERIHCL